ncbi:hypothetical protein CQA53_09975 [Helicobacter didelphidarum]|uniref:Uncharacterized protein n=1 Tax=Helicobacter didelphidarum TaxID=2040648 RepID=A0A3D8IAH6_9HELI|nr:hypothetical protein [Helicobacter didelphidarum]RDU61541.1 hypothetical protein CQA53_09975 [Helicobacter didelphidarum]
MNTLRLTFLISLCLVFVSCAKPVYTSFETYTAKIVSIEHSDLSDEARKKLYNHKVIEEESYKNAAQILKQKNLIDYKAQWDNQHNIQINQYEIARKVSPNFEGMEFTIKDKTNDTIWASYGKEAKFNVSYDKRYLGICDDKRKLHIFDIENNLYELEHYKDKKCRDVYFSLDNKYLILNNKNQGQIYDFKTANLVYDNPNNSIYVNILCGTHCWDYNIAMSNLILGYVETDNEIILLDEERRIIVDLGDESKNTDFSVIKKDKGSIYILVTYYRQTWVPFVSLKPMEAVFELQEIKKTRI